MTMSPRSFASPTAARSRSSPTARGGAGLGGALSGSPAERFVSPAVGVKELDAFLDTPILDPNERGGPLEPLKAFVRSEPETAQVAASVLALTFFFVLARGLVAVLD